MSGNSTRTTGNDALSGVDPGGTHSTKPGNPDKSGASQPAQVQQNVQSGDGHDSPGPRKNEPDMSPPKN